MVLALELTEQQRQAIEAQGGRPVEVIDPATNRLYVLVSAETFARVQRLLEQEKGPEPEETAGIPPGILRSQQAFWRDLPELLKNRRHYLKWAAYHGDERIGIGSTPTELIREILRQGIPREDYYVGRIQPQDLPPWEPIEVEPIHLHHLEDFPPEA
ncbi:MAG: hypothetical protein JO112_03870 [Planctomycetes bacterium]|nr:hypothetical protein [Planctomycetota bacterium]